MSKRFCLAWITAILFFCTGCQHRGAADTENWKVVSEITIICENNGALTRRIYTSQEKMRQILNSIRSLGQKSTPPVDPESFQARTYRITLTHTDGSQRIFSTKADRYIREGWNPWQQADPERVSELNLLLQNLPGDVPGNELRMELPHLRTLPGMA